MKKILLFILISTVFQGFSQKKKHIYVADHLVDCTGVAPQKCMLVKDKIVDPWSTYYGTIEGFDYEEGYEYLLKVKIKKIKNPPADAPDFKYILLEVYEKKKTEKQEPLTLDGTWKVISMNGVEEMENPPTITFNSEEKRVSGFTGCNNFFGSYDPDTKQMDFSKMGTTRKMCPDMSVENNFLNNLREISHYQIEGNQLLFYNKDNGVLMTCEIEK